MDQIKNFLELELLSVNEWKLKVINLVWVVLILSAAYLLRWLFRKYLNRLVKLGRLDAGKSYAIFSVSSYFIFIVAIMTVIDSLGFNVTVLLASSTAVLLGLGLGIQDLFKDMVAGFIILFERTVTAGDIVEIAGTVGEVKDVGIRTTSLLTREGIVLIVPNSKLTNDNVINWSQNNRVTRFGVDVGVAYGSDTQKVEKLLLEAAAENQDVIAKPEPIVFFKDFGESSLDFTLFFFSRNLFRIERTKSDLRFAIDKKFRENNVAIPFPQRDIWFRNNPAKDTE
ncbi:MAG: mechanosensitive ion channel family protein [Croceimicrobium sp.]|nr:mechanosensitive ion channel [Bacteroidota bacterium]